MNLGLAWRTLGLARTAEIGAIRRAYADRLRALDVDREVGAYSDLRTARDTALHWARQQDRKDVGDPLADAETPPPEQTPAPSWAYAAPLLEKGPEAAAGTPSLTLGGDDTGLFLPPTSAAPSGGEPRSIPADLADPFAVPALRGSPQPPYGALVQPAMARDAALHALLYPDGGEEGRPFDAGEEDRALGHLRSVLRDADSGDISHHEAVEYWLADTLAGAWPRSAPLLAEAAAAFGWEREAGKLGERPAIGYLNARLKGLRFHERVLKPSHPLHKAWLELSRPGHRNWLDKIRGSQADVTQLLDGVRKHFPELESHLDAERVVSWEQNSSGVSSPWPVWLTLVVAFQLLAAIGRCSGDSASDTASLPPIETVAQLDTATLDLAADEIFGGGTSYEDVVLVEPKLASTISSNLSYARTAKESDEAGLARAIDVVRTRVYFAGQEAGGTDLDTAMRLRLGQLRAARAVDTEACMQLIRYNVLDPRVTLPPELRAQERAFAKALLIGSRLKVPERQEPSTASVPGLVVERVIRDSGLSEAKVRSLMQGKGTDKDTCTLHIALLGATLDYRGKERAAILRTL